MNQTKTQIPHYIHKTQSSQAKILKQTEIPSKLSRPKVTKYGLNGRKKSTENEQEKDDRQKSEQSEISSLKSQVEKQQEMIATLESSSEKENVLRDEIRTLESRFQQTDKKLENYEKQLLLCNINPVTLESLEPTSETKDSLREIGNKKKLEVHILKASIDDMNSKTQKVLYDLKKIGGELDDICSGENSGSSIK